MVVDLIHDWDDEELIKKGRESGEISRTVMKMVNEHHKIVEVSARGKRRIEARRTLNATLFVASLLGNARVAFVSYS